jgi:hypothetical protein
MTMDVNGIVVHVQIDSNKNVSLECLKYAHENGCPWDAFTCSRAAHNGHLECLKYAHDNGCRWDRYTCSNAAKNCQLEKYIKIQIKRKWK